MAPIERSLDRLHPDFAERVTDLLERLRARGLSPMIWETWRSFERAAELQRRGSGIAMSMHCYGLACDIISERTHWNAPPEFWAALGEEAETLGLTWGGRFHRVDKPHVQALPARMDAEVRALTDTARSLLVTQHLDANDPAKQPTVRERVLSDSQDTPNNPTDWVGPRRKR